MRSSSDYPAPRPPSTRRGTIPANYKSVALDAYARAADAALGANDSAGAIAPRARGDRALARRRRVPRGSAKAQLLAQHSRRPRSRLRSRAISRRARSSTTKRAASISDILSARVLPRRPDRRRHHRDARHPQARPGETRAVVNAAFNAYAGSAQQQAQSGNTAAAAGISRRPPAASRSSPGNFIHARRACILAVTGKARLTRARRPKRQGARRRSEQRPQPTTTPGSRRRTAAVAKMRPLSCKRPKAWRRLQQQRAGNPSGRCAQTARIDAALDPTDNDSYGH